MGLYSDEMVIGNLLSNASVRRGAANRDLGDAVAEHRPPHVKDHGLGISRSSRHESRKVRAGGLGGALRRIRLGLWIAREIVEAHGGSIRVISEPGQGSAFTVELRFFPANRALSAARSVGFFERPFA